MPGSIQDDYDELRMHPGICQNASMMMKMDLGCIQGDAKMHLGRYQDT